MAGVANKIPKGSECECFTWAQASSVLLDHNPACEHYDAIRDLKVIICGLLDAMDIWACDEDGVHPEAYEAYDRAAISVFRSPLKGETNANN